MTKKMFDLLVSVRDHVAAIDAIVDEINNSSDKEFKLMPAFEKLCDEYFCDAVLEDPRRKFNEIKY